MGGNEKLRFWYMGKPIEDVGVATTLTCAPELPDKAIRVWNGSQIPKDDTDFKSLSEKTAKAFEKSCNDYLETLSEVSKSLNPCLERLATLLAKPHKNKKKHYKPKFTL